MKRELSHIKAVNLFREYTDWSREASEAIISYFEKYEDSTGESINLDPIAIACEFTEYEAEDLICIYGAEDATLEETLDYLKENTELIIVKNYGKDDTYIVGYF
jgi:hypothetical protein